MALSGSAWFWWVQGCLLLSLTPGRWLSSVGSQRQHEKMRQVRVWILGPSLFRSWLCWLEGLSRSLNFSNSHIFKRGLIMVPPSGLLGWLNEIIHIKCLEHGLKICLFLLSPLFSFQKKSLWAGRVYWPWLAYHCTNQILSCLVPSDKHMMTNATFPGILFHLGYQPSFWIPFYLTTSSHSFVPWASWIAA